MKIAAFSVRPDEKQYFDTFANVYKVELQINRSGFTADDIESVKGCEAMSVCDGISLIGTFNTCLNSVPSK